MLQDSCGEKNCSLTSRFHSTWYFIYFAVVCSQLKLNASSSTPSGDFGLFLPTIFPFILHSSFPNNFYVLFTFSVCTAHGINQRKQLKTATYINLVFMSDCYFASIFYSIADVFYIINFIFFVTFHSMSHSFVICLIKYLLTGPDLGGPWGPGLQASHQKGASHQTLQFLFRAHYRVN